MQNSLYKPTAVQTHYGLLGLQIRRASAVLSKARFPPFYLFFCKYLRKMKREQEARQRGSAFNLWTPLGVMAGLFVLFCFN